MVITDDDALKRLTIELGEDGLEKVRGRAAARSAAIDPDEADRDRFEPPGADLSGEELTVAVVPMLDDEFRCSRCFLAIHRSQRAVPDGDFCRECV
jgi:hypothetical protein